MKAIIKLKPYALFLVIASLLFLTIVIIENINGKFWLNDFKVMYSAADAFLSGEQVYGKSFGLDTGFYKYSPLSLLAFVPYTLLNYPIAAILHFIVIAFFTLFTVLSTQILVVKHFFYNATIKRVNWISLGVLLFILLHLVRELHLGNINIVLVGLIVLLLKNTIANKLYLAGILFALIVFTKPYFIILGLPILLYNYKVLIRAALFSIIVLALFSVVYGFQNSFELHKEWLNAMLDHSSYLTSNHTIYSIVDNLLNIELPLANSLTGLILITLLIAIPFIIKKVKKEYNAKDFIYFICLLLAIIPNLLITDTEHFLFSLPIIVFTFLSVIRNRNTVLLSLFCTGIFFYAINSGDLLGNTLSNFIEKNGFLGIANLLLIGAAIYAYTLLLQSKKTQV